MHSKPTDDSDNQRGQNAQNARTIRAELKTTEPPPTEPPAKNVESKIEEPNLITFDDPSSSKLVQPLPNPAVLQGMSHKSIITSSEKVLAEVISVKKLTLWIIIAGFFLPLFKHKHRLLLIDCYETIVRCW